MILDLIFEGVFERYVPIEATEHINELLKLVSHLQILLKSLILIYNFHECAHEIWKDRDSKN